MASLCETIFDIEIIRLCYPPKVVVVFNGMNIEHMFVLRLQHRTEILIFPFRVTSLIIKYSPMWMESLLAIAKPCCLVDYDQGMLTSLIICHIQASIGVCK